MVHLHIRTDSATGSLSSETSVWVSRIYTHTHTNTSDLTLNLLSYCVDSKLKAHYYYSVMVSGSESEECKTTKLNRHELGAVSFITERT